MTATRVRRGRAAAAAAAAGVTLTAVTGALLGVGGPTAAPAYAGQPAAAMQAHDGAPGSRAPEQGPQQSAEAALLDRPERAVPADSGTGRRVVFDQSDQQVWLVRDNGSVARTYPVSGSIYDNLDPGSYEVYSRSAQAWAFDASGSMRWMVRFTTGDNAAIGFHDIPVDDAGRKAQSRAELGTPQSHGCIRQWPDDAKALWRFAPLGTPVVVTA